MINTEYSVSFVDAEAFLQALGEEMGFDVIEQNLENIDINNKAEVEEAKIKVEISRVAMDGLGYIVGHEVISIAWKAYLKSDLNIFGIPNITYLCNFVVAPKSYNIVDRFYPPEELAEDNDEEEFFGYTHPDDDFWYNEIDYLIENLNFPEAVFNSSERIWTLGYQFLNLNK